MSDDDRVQALFLATLARDPTDDEAQSCQTALAASKDAAERGQAMSDILWALRQQHRICLQPLRAYFEFRQGV